jgi:hypothetical protein
MKSPWPAVVVAALALVSTGVSRDAPAPRKTAVAIERKTVVSIRRGDFVLNGRVTFAGRQWRGHRIEGLLPNSRMVQGVFDDLNVETRSRWAYPDTGTWDPERNTTEFVAAMKSWRAHGLLAVTINLQGGSPEGYSKGQPWHNSGFEASGALRPAYMARLERVLDEADRLGMAVILGLFYFGQDQRLADERAVLKAVDDTVAWVLDKGYGHVLIEVNNECDGSYDHEILRPSRVHELIERVKGIARGGKRLLASTSYQGGRIPSPAVVAASDYILLHGNGVHDPDRIEAMVRETRQVNGYDGQPIVFNEDDHFGFDQPRNNFVAATAQHASWGYFDYRMKGEGFDEGYQSMPANWGLSSARKRGFFALLSEMTGSAGR